MPWKVLGQKWHFSRKGFPLGKSVYWEPAVLEELCEALQATAPAGKFLWNNQQVVHMMVAPLRDPWATIYTKRREAVELQLNGPRDKFALGRIAALGMERQIAPDVLSGRDQIKIRFDKAAQILTALKEFLREHLEQSGVRAASAAEA